MAFSDSSQHEPTLLHPPPLPNLSGYRKRYRPSWPMGSFGLSCTGIIPGPGLAFLFPPETSVGFRRVLLREKSSVGICVLKHRGLGSRCRVGPIASVRTLHTGQAPAIRREIPMARRGEVWVGDSYPWVLLYGQFVGIIR